MTNIELISKIRNLQELRRMSEELSAEMEGIQAEIKAHMTARDLTELTAGPFRVSWTTVMTSRLDTRALAKDHPDLAARYTRTTPSRRFQVR